MLGPCFGTMGLLPGDAVSFRLRRGAPLLGSPAVMEAVSDLLERSSRVLDLRCCYHDFRWPELFPPPWRNHSNAACAACKRADLDSCVRFCGLGAERQLRRAPEPAITTCPWGFRECLVPVRNGGLLRGALFAGPCWL